MSCCKREENLFVRTAEKLRLIRELHDIGYTQDQFAEKLKVSKWVYRNWESGRTRLPERVAKALGQELGFDWRWFYDDSRQSVPDAFLVQEKQIGVMDNRSKHSAYLPLYPEVPAGDWSFASSEVIEYISVPAHLAGENRFATKIVGDSMQPKVIHGDIVVVQRSHEPRPGVITLAVSKDGESTIKVLERVGQTYRLRPINPAYPTTDTRTYTLIGFAIAIIRVLSAGTKMEIFNESGLKQDYLP